MYYTKRTVANINLDNIIFNAKSYQRAIGDIPLMCVVKANAYGHSAKAIATCLQDDLGVKWFAVANIDEAIRLREQQIRGNILILGYTDPTEADRLIQYDIIQACMSYEYAEALNSFVSNQFAGKSRVKVHIKFDTGMSRIGIPCDDTGLAVREAEKIYRLPNLVVGGIFTHLCVADSNNADDEAYTKLQIDKIKEVRFRLEQNEYYVGCCHWLNSAGGVYTDSEGSDLARLGIILYGLKPDSSLELPIEIRPVMELVSTVSMVKTIKSGTFVGYGRTFQATKDMKLATVTVGYADGYPRLLSNKGEVLINGTRCKVVGRVCMDQITVDATNAEVEVGDDVILIGKQGDEEITVDDIASLCGTINYEIVCGISSRVYRRAFRNGKQVLLD